MLFHLLKTTDFFAITATGEKVVTFVEILPGFLTFSTKTSPETAVPLKNRIWQNFH